MRSLVPAETLVYLETNELAAALQPIVDAKPFMEVAKSKPDFSALKGVQLAVAVTGFETSEEKLTDEHSVGRVQPRFVAVADTHAWNSNAVAFAEKKLGSFVANIYDSEPTLEKTDKHGGKYFTWTATDGRKAYALVIDSIIYFGNDESAIEKCLAVKRGETDSILKTGKIPVASPEILASGYVSTDGIAQIAALVGLKFASEAADESEIQSAIAGILPQLLRNSVTEISWTSTKTEKGIEDKYKIGMPTDISNVFNDTLAPSNSLAENFAEFLPDTALSATRYEVRDPQIAWRSLLFVAKKQADSLSGKIMDELSNGFFEPYGIDNAELFLSSIGGRITTAKFDDDVEKLVVIASFGDASVVKRALLNEINFNQLPEKEYEASIWQTSDGDLMAAFFDQILVLGTPENVKQCLAAHQDPTKALSNKFKSSFKESDATASSFGSDTTSAQAIAEVLANEDHRGKKMTSPYFTETRFTKTGIDRRTISDFGLIGSIIAQLGGDE